MEKNISLQDIVTISKDIVAYLHKKENLSFEEISILSESPHKDVESIFNGKKNFSDKNFKALIKNLDKSLVEILSLFCPESHLPKNLKNTVSFYKKNQKRKKRY